MITNTITVKPFSDLAAPLPCAQIQGAPSRLHLAVVVNMAPIADQVLGGAVSTVKYGGPGSRAWSPPV